MFYVNKHDLPRYYYVYAGNVRERIGEAGPESERDFKEFIPAFMKAQQMLAERYASDYKALTRRLSKMERFIYGIRTIWNSKIRDSLAQYEEKVEAAKKLADCLPAVEVEWLPLVIPCVGDRIPLGTVVYLIDNYSLKFDSAKVVEEDIRYSWASPDGSTAYYTLDNDKTIRSDLDSNFSNQEVYLDKQKAKERFAQLIEERKQTLDERLKALQ